MNIFNEKIENAKTICILGHQNPDGDCIGSALAIYNYITNKYKNKKNVLVHLDNIAKKYKILPNAEIINDKIENKTFDLVIIVDSASLNRIGDFEMYFKNAKDTLLIDHHEKNSIPAKVSIVNENSIATCEILFDQLEKEYIDKNVAICLYAGLATDSGVFRYRNTTKKTFSIVSYLLNFDFDFSMLLDTLIFNNTYEQRKAQAIAFERLETYCEGKISFSYITQDELDKLNLIKADVDNIVVYLREMVGVLVAGFAYQVSGAVYKLSLRSNSDFLDMSLFASMHEGGGHKRAAGCIYYGDINNIARNFKNDMESFINEYIKQ